MRRAPQQRQNQRRRAAAMVEMAFVLPVFFTVVLGIIEFGRAMMVGQLITNAAREGARLAILQGTTNSEVEESVLEFLENAANISAGDASITITVTPAPGNDSSGNEVANAQTRDLVTVRIEVPFDRVSYIRSRYLAERSLVGQAAMRHE